MYIFLDGLKAPTTVGVLYYGNLMGPSTIWFPHFGSQVYFSFFPLANTSFLRLTLKDLEGRKTHTTYITVNLIAKFCGT